VQTIGLSAVCLLSLRSSVLTLHGTAVGSTKWASEMYVTSEVSTAVGDYEEWHLLGYKNPVRTSQETHYVSATEPSRLMLCNI
jgi:hypothetical protein